MSPTCHSLFSTSDRLSYWVHAVLRASPHAILRAALWRGSLHHKIAMHVNSRVHGSNEPWQWMLSDFKRLHPYAPPPVLSPQHMSVWGMCSPDQLGQRSKLTDREESKVTCMRFNVHERFSPKNTSTCAQLHTVTALFQSSFKKSIHIQYVDKSNSVLRWQAGCVSLTAAWYSIIRNQESDNLFVSLHTPSPALQMEAQCNFHLWIYCKANGIRCLPAPQTHPE